MKKRTWLLLTSLVLALGLTLTACGGSGSAPSSAPSENAAVTGAEDTGDDATAALTLAEVEDGTLQCLDTQTSPFDDCGIRTAIDTSAGTVTFVKTDLEGNDTVEYLKFTPAENEAEKYYYVSMMGTGFYYYYDLTAGEMVRMEDAEHKDTTQSAKENNRFDGAAETMSSEVEALQTYFEESFGSTMADAVGG